MTRTGAAEGSGRSGSGMGLSLRAISAKEAHLTSPSASMFAAVWERTCKPCIEQVMVAVHDQRLAKEGA